MSIRSIFYFVDEFFGIPDYFNGNGLVATLDWLIDYIAETDDTIYNSTGYHVFNYPEVILDKCYRCKYPLNTKEVRRAKSKMFHNLTYRIPPLTDEYTRRFMMAGEDFGRVFEDM